jgi:hypothetical protein
MPVKLRPGGTIIPLWGLHHLGRRNHPAATVIFARKTDPAAIKRAWRSRWKLRRPPKRVPRGCSTLARLAAFRSFETTRRAGSPGLGDVVREGRRKDRRSRDRLCAARKATAFLPDRMIELYLSWSVARLPVRDGKATYAAQKLMMEPSFQSQALWQRCASFSFLMVEGCIKHYQGFQIEPFEAGRGLWHARLRRIDRKPMTIDGISLPTLEVGFAWPDSDAAIAHAIVRIDQMKHKLS